MINVFPENSGSQHAVGPMEPVSTLNTQRWQSITLVMAFLCLVFSRGVLAADAKFELNLKNTDIHSLIGTISKNTGRNFVVDPRVKAKVTVISSQPMSGDELYEVFLSVLQVHGFSAVPTGDVIKIVPIEPRT